MDTPNRRRHPRVATPAMYTAVALRLVGQKRFTHEGHAYDVSEGGMQFELDRAIPAGTPVEARLELPVSFGDSTATCAVTVFGNVVWADESEPGPARMAVAFTRFADAVEGATFLTRLNASCGRRRAA